jgi:hypothetical protein
VEKRSLPVGVNAPTVLVPTGVGLVRSFGELKIPVVSGRLIRPSAATADPIVQQSREGERIVANKLSVETAV